MLKRGPQLYTCPNSWGLVGEHSSKDETPLETLKRGLQEELWTNHIKNNNGIDSVIAFYQNLTSHPVFYYRQHPNRRVDRQITYMYEVRLRHDHTEIQFQLDEEVADYQWIPLDEYERRLDADNAVEEFCHSSMIDLLRLTIKRMLFLRGRTEH